MSNRGHTGMAAQSPGGHRDLFLEQSYLVLSCILDPGHDLEPLGRRWQKLVPNQESWLDLHRHGSRFRAIRCSFFNAIDRLRGQVSGFFTTKYRSTDER